MTQTHDQGRRSALWSEQPPATCTILFTPEKTSVEVPRGTSILTAARSAGVFINSLCGGDGVCGKCRVNVHIGRVCGGTNDFLTREEIREGYVLACEAHAESDLVVEIPETSRMVGEVHEGDASASRFGAIEHQERGQEVIDPLVQKYYVALTPPSLENNISDLARLEHHLRQKMGGGEFQMGLKVIRSLPGVLREADWKVTATVACRGPLDEITEVARGSTSRQNLSVVVDLGTTTVVAHLVDLGTGQTIGGAAKYNSQAQYGGDIVRRILWATRSPDSIDRFQQVTVEDIGELIMELKKKHHFGFSDVSSIVAAGNTTMIHFLLGLSPMEIRREPYVGVAYSPPPLRAAELGLKINPRGLLYCLPSISAFVGADVVAGVLAVGLPQREKPSMLIDIGTNGEIVIGNREWLMCASASAGPAFEGSETRCGMRATFGAIDHIRLADPDSILSFSTIGDKPPVGVCGSGFVDLLAEMLRLGVMDKTGRLNTSLGCRRIRQREDDVPEFVIAWEQEAGEGRDVAIGQEDILNLMRAKAAIYAASQILMRQVGLTLDDLEEIMVAGAFGNYLNVENAVLIGLLPDMASGRIRFVGNTSIAGAKKICLSRAAYRQAETVARSITYCELSTDPRFMEEFVSASFFPHTDVAKFPTAMAKLKL